MRMRQLSLLGVVIAVACNGRLTVPDDPGSAGSAGHNLGVAGHGDLGIAGSTITPEGGNGVGGNLIGVSGHNGVAGEGPIGAGGSVPGAGGEGPFGTGGLGIAGWIGTGGWYGTAGLGGSIGTAGSGGAPVGNLGQPCIPGGLVTEAVGTPAQTQIKTLPRCADGLACDASSVCVPTPDCTAETGLCVVRHAVVNGSGGSGGSFGTAGSSSTAGSFNTGGSGSETTTIGEAGGVVALTANESHVYWLEYGTRDGLGNALNDGTLMSYSLADGTTQTLVTGLHGPIGLELTTTHAYVYVDGAPLIGSPTKPQLLRVPLAGGSAVLVQDGTRRSGFAAAGGQAFWDANTNIYSVLSDSSATPAVFSSNNQRVVASDGTTLYCQADALLVSSPIANAAFTVLDFNGNDLAPHDDGLYMLEANSAGALLLRAPKSGGLPQRVRALGAGSPRNLKVTSARYFLEVYPDFFNEQVLTAGFTGSDPPIRLLQRAARRSLVDQLWVGTANALFWSDSRLIYKQPLPTP